jgi:hypothetical protein
MASTVIKMSARKFMAKNAELVATVEMTGWWLVNMRLRAALVIAWVASKVAGTGFRADVTQGRS